jgi:undecaprenyl-diphosphatase
VETSLFQVILLAVVQGITEFLPISSSGHLAVLQNFFGFEAEESLVMTVVLHAGTLLSIIVYYWKDLVGLITRGQGTVIAKIAVGTVPLVFIGLWIKPMIAGLSGNMTVVACCFGYTALLLIFVHNSTPKGKTVQTMNWRDVMFISLAQAIAILPGVSRSGSTIAVGTRMGLDHDDAARFSFFLGIPAIGGAVVLTIKDLVEAQQAGIALQMNVTHLAIGLVVSFIVGYFAIICLIKVLRAGKFAWFGYYVAILGLLLLIR